MLRPVPLHNGQIPPPKKLSYPPVVCSKSNATEAPVGEQYAPAYTFVFEESIVGIDNESKLRLVIFQ